MGHGLKPPFPSHTTTMACHAQHQETHLFYWACSSMHVQVGSVGPMLQTSRAAAAAAAAAAEHREQARVPWPAHPSCTIPWTQWCCKLTNQRKEASPDRLLHVASTVSCPVFGTMQIQREHLLFLDEPPASLWWVWQVTGLNNRFMGNGI